MADSLLASWLPAFLLTQVIEAPVVVAATRRHDPAVDVGRALVASFVATGLSHPLLWFGWTRVVSDYGAFVFSGELLVVGLEAVVIALVAHPMRLGRALLVSLAANATSLVVGSALRLLGL
ncbi:MAG: hypothetical protein JRI25_15790 [Deltaproteobacteria bacterium]|nr:hypothetical protein [Deltaproteobacteria bacterium]MBW2256045.1 hypothetical protein [Deltaproteobacteria bacterium]